MNDDNSTHDHGLTRTVKVGVGALVVLAVAAVAGGGYWYLQRNKVPTCGSPEATSLVTKILMDNIAKGLPPGASAVFSNFLRVSLDTIERGELSADGNVRKCSAQLVATLSPEMKSFASANFPGIHLESDNRISAPIEYELKALEESGKFLTSVPGSPQLAAFGETLSGLARTYQPPPATTRPPINAVSGEAAASDDTSSQHAEPNWQVTVQTVAALATVPTTADFTHRDWGDLEKHLPAYSWMDSEEGGLIVKSAEVEKTNRTTVNIRVKGARTMVTETGIYRTLLGEVEEGVALWASFNSALSPEVIRCDSDEEASTWERWYRVTPAGLKPLIARFSFSSGNAGSSEELLFTREENDLPVIGSDATGGTWTDQCKS